MSINHDLLHLGRPEGPVRPVNTPIEMASTYLFDSLADYEAARAARFEPGTLNYGRYGTQSTFALEAMMAKLEGGHGCVAVSSGLTAVTMAIMPFVSSGCHILIANSVYGPTRGFCSDVLSRMAVTAEYFDPMIGADIASLLRPETSAIVLETPGSGTFEVPDLRAIAAVARKAGVVTIVDNTWATPTYLRPLELGLDISVHSGTKYLSGHSDVMIGLITANEACFDRIRRSTLAFGERASPTEIFLTLRGLRTLGVRMERHAASGIKVANWLANQKRVRSVLHPALPDCPGHDIWKRDFDGAAGVFSFIMDPVTKPALADFIDKLELFGIGLSWGGFESLILPVDVSAVRTAPRWSQDGQIIRLSIGLDDPDALITDLAAGFDRLDAFA